MRKIVAIVWATLLQNRWQLLLLAAWPWLFTLLLQYAGGAPTADDVASLLHQECLYGLALIAILASNAFGTELRSRRVVFVLSRAVSRKQYLAALWLSAVVPGMVYLLSMMGSGLIANGRDRLDITSFLHMLLALLFLMVWVGALGVLSSMLLPGFMAWVGVGMAAAFILYLSCDNMYQGPGQLARSIVNGPLLRGQAVKAIDLVSVAGTLLQTTIFAVLAYSIFQRKDIQSLSD